MKHKLIVFLFTTLLSVGVLLPLVKLPVNAAQTITHREEYKIWRSYLMVYECLDESFTDPTAQQSEDDRIKKIFQENKRTNAGQGDFAGNRLDDRPGDYFLEDVLGLDSEKFGCGVKEDIYPALEVLGFGNGIEEFADYLNEGDFRAGGDEIKKDEVRKGLQSIVQEKGARLGLDQEADFQYWYFRSLFEADEDVGGCSGSLLNNREKDSSTPGTYYYVKSDGSIFPRTYANYNKGTTEHVEGMDEFMTRVMSDDKPTCVNIANQLTEARAQAFANWISTASDEVRAAQESETSSNSSIDPDGGEQRETCEETANSFFAWAACPLIGALNDTADWLFDFADSLLNIEAQKIYEDDGLRTVWGYFRVIATLALLAVGLVMVISQAVGGQ